MGMAYGWFGVMFLVALWDAKRLRVKSHLSVPPTRGDIERRQARVIHYLGKNDLYDSE